MYVLEDIIEYASLSIAYSVCNEILSSADCAEFYIDQLKSHNTLWSNCYNWATSYYNSIVDTRYSIATDYFCGTEPDLTKIEEGMVYLVLVVWNGCKLGHAFVLIKHDDYYYFIDANGIPPYNNLIKRKMSKEEFEEFYNYNICKNYKTGSVSCGKISPEDQILDNIKRNYEKLYQKLKDVDDEVFEKCTLVENLCDEAFGYKNLLKDLSYDD